MPFESADAACDVCIYADKLSNQASEARAKAELTHYVCIKCKEVTEHSQEKGQFSICKQCGLKSTYKLRPCQSCKNKTYLFCNQESKMVCIKCYEGFCPLKVSGVVPLPCLFCDDELQTWYMYRELNKMRC